MEKVDGNNKLSELSKEESNEKSSDQMIFDNTIINDNYIYCHENHPQSLLKYDTIQIYVTICGKLCRALIDTGASINILYKNIFIENVNNILFFIPFCNFGFIQTYIIKTFCTQSIFLFYLFSSFTIILITIYTLCNNWDGFYA